MLARKTVIFPSRPGFTSMALRVKIHVHKKTFDYKARFLTTLPRRVVKNLRTILIERFLILNFLIPKVFNFNLIMLYPAKFCS